MHKTFIFSIMLSFQATCSSLAALPSTAVLLVPADAGAAKLEILSERLKAISGVKEVSTNPAGLEKVTPALIVAGYGGNPLLARLADKHRIALGEFDLNGDGWYDADAFWTPLSELQSVSDTEANIITWDPDNYTATLRLTERGVSWRNLPNGPWFLLVLDGDRVADPRGTLLDGDADGIPGGDFQYLFYRS